MAEDLQSNLKNYQLQLQQVEAALAGDAENEELQKLKSDLQEVLNLTIDLIKNQDAGTSASIPSVDEEDEPSTSKPTHNWKVGDKCLTAYSQDGLTYEAIIEELLDDGTCTVTFDGYEDSEVTQISNLKSLEEEKGGTKRKYQEDSKQPKASKKDLIAQQREYKRKKTQKKVQRRKQMEEEMEGEKNKWLSFNTKTFSKTAKGKVKKSIFASPDSVEGKVGVGTCGQSGRPMTSYHQNEKWKKGMH